jgi:flagellar motor switch protein FliG
MAEIAPLSNTMTGLRKAAVLLMQLDKAESAQVLSMLKEDEVENISSEIARMGAVRLDDASKVIKEFHEMAGRPRPLQGGLDYARELLEAAVGEQRAGEILGRLAAAMSDVPFGFLTHADPRQVLTFVQNEHPQTIALVLAHVPAGVASSILANLDAELQSDVANRIAIMDSTSPEVVRQLEATMERKLSSMLQPTEVSTVGGLMPLVEIINRADRSTERMILEGLDARNPQLAEEVRKKMFVFEDIVHLEDRAIQLLVREVEVATLATALKGVNNTVKTKLTKNLSERGRENLEEEIELLGPVRLSAVEEAQATIVQAIRGLEAVGQIEISRGDNSDEFVA